MTNAAGSGLPVLPGAAERPLTKVVAQRGIERLDTALSYHFPKADLQSSTRQIVRTGRTPLSRSVTMIG
jgi:hypothetical protein